MNVLLISTYELGRQPFGLASPAAWLNRAGASVRCLDVSRQEFREDWVRAADLIAFYVPMHTATRLGVMLLEPVRKLNARAHICFYGLYAPMNDGYLRSLGVESAIGGEFEGPLVELVERLKMKEFKAEVEESTGEIKKKGIEGGMLPIVSLARQNFIVPNRSALPELKHYAHLRMPDGSHRMAGYTEASRGCKHLCRHCPIVPVYHGVFRIIEEDVVLNDIRQQVAAGAQHITFGDPDFLNGPRHAIRIVEALKRAFPAVTYDATIKIEHLLQHDELLPVLRDTGCAFVVTAVESVDDRVLEHLAKGHTRADFLAVVRRCREIGLPLQPTFVPFTPWTTLDSYCELLRLLAREGLAGSIPAIQLAIRLLIPAGSLLLELEDVRKVAGEFNREALVHPWRHPDPRVDALAETVQSLAERGEKNGRTRAKLFAEIWEAAQRAAGGDEPAPVAPALAASATAPYLTEPWYC